jgi:hypothetical protein
MEPLPENPYMSYVPHDSFDRNGFLKPEAYNAGDQSKKIELSPEDKSKLRAKHALNSALICIADEIIVEVVNEDSAKTAQAMVNTVAMIEVAKEVMVEVANKVCLELGFFVAKEAIKEAKNEELYKRLQNEAKIAASEEVIDDITDEVTIIIFYINLTFGFSTVSSQTSADILLAACSALLIHVFMVN